MQADCVVVLPHRPQLLFLLPIWLLDPISSPPGVLSLPQKEGVETPRAAYTCPISSSLLSDRLVSGHISQTDLTRLGIPPVACRVHTPPHPRLNNTRGCRTWGLLRALLPVAVWLEGSRFIVRSKPHFQAHVHRVCRPPRGGGEQTGCVR